MLLVVIGSVLQVLAQRRASRSSGASLLGALGGVTPPPGRLLLRCRPEKVCQRSADTSTTGWWPRAHQCDWTVAGLDLVGERADRVVVQWFTAEASMTQAGC